MKTELLIYILALLVLFATSLLTIVLIPKLLNIASRPVTERANEYCPRDSAPRYRANIILSPKLEINDSS